MLQGIYPVLPTLFHEDASLDLDAQRAVVRYALDAGAHGLVFPGVASEYQFLEPGERATLLRLVVEESSGRVPIVAGASAPEVEEVVTHGRAAMELGIDHLMIMAPHRIGRNVAAQQSFFAEVAAGLPEARIVLQNAPPPGGAGLAAADLVEVVAALEAVSHVKEESLPSGPAISRLRAEMPSHLVGVLGGGGARYIIDELNRGAVGAMPAVELTALHVALYDAHSSGDAARARELYRLSLPLLVAQAVYRMRLTKHILVRKGLATSGFVRASLPELDESARGDIDRMLADLEAVFP